MGCLSSLSLEHAANSGFVMLSPTAMVIDAAVESEASRVTTPRAVMSAAGNDKVDVTTVKPAPVEDVADTVSGNMIVGDMTSILSQLLAEDTVYHQNINATIL